MNFDWNDKDALIAACNESDSATEVLRKLGYRKGGYSYRTLKHYAELYGIDVPVNPKRSGIKQRRSLEEILVLDSTFNNGSHLKERLLKENILEEKCYNKDCLVSGPEWLGNRLVLQLEHINGNPTDNRIENLCLLCPNCHSQTDTWGRKTRTMVSGVGKRDTTL